jgi:Flp pilus assembly protein TadB
MSVKGLTRHATAEYIRAEQQRLSAIPTHLREREVSPYERFLELPVPIVLVVCWLAGVALIGLCASVLLLLWLLLGVAAGT